MATRKIRRLKRINPGDVNATSPPTPSAAALVHSPPRVSPGRVKLVVGVLTVCGFAAIGADCWMSWEGFRTLPVDWWIAATLTAGVAVSQLGSGVIQSLGGNPFQGIGGNAQGDAVWGLTLKGLYGLDIFSNFSGFGGQQYLSLGALMADPLGTIGLLFWFGLLATLLAFLDEIVFRLRDRIAIGAQANQQRAKIRDIQIKAHDVALAEYRSRAMQQAADMGQRMGVSFDWVEGGDGDA